MSQENVEVVREAWEAAERHDNEAIFPLYDADITRGEALSAVGLAE